VRPSREGHITKRQDAALPAWQSASKHILKNGDIAMFPWVPVIHLVGQAVKSAFGSCSRPTLIYEIDNSSPHIRSLVDVIGGIITSAKNGIVVFEFTLKNRTFTGMISINGKRMDLRVFSNILFPNPMPGDVKEFVDDRDSSSTGIDREVVEYSSDCVIAMKNSSLSAHPEPHAFISMIGSLAGVADLNDVCLGVLGYQRNRN
jgi:hypothetical protein